MFERECKMNRNLLKSINGMRRKLIAEIQSNMKIVYGRIVERGQSNMSLSRLYLLNESMESLVKNYRRLQFQMSEKKTVKSFETNSLRVIEEIAKHMKKPSTKLSVYKSKKKLRLREGITL